MVNPSSTPGSDDELVALVKRGRRGHAWDVDAMWRRLRADTIDLPEGARRPLTVGDSVSDIRGGRRRRFAMLAAIGGLAAAASLWLVASRGSDVRAPVQSASVALGHEYSTAAGERIPIELSDGTRVTLAADSKLSVPPNYGDGARNVVLVGEAIFEVRHDSLRPFRVRAGNAELVDLGTRFAVRAYDSTSTVTVAVAEGVVAVSVMDSVVTRPAPVVLERGEIAQVRDGQISVDSTHVAERVFDWKPGAVSFEDQPLHEVIATIGRWYELEISADNALRDRRVDAKFTTATTDPRAMLDIIAAAIEAKVEPDGHRLLIAPIRR